MTVNSTGAEAVAAENGPLVGVTVVSLEQAIAAPLATRHLADLGARVIKIERPDGGDFARSYDQAARGLSSHFAWVNRSKESVSLNLRHPGARRVLDRLIGRADVVIHNMSPARAEELGLTAAVMRENNQRLIVCTISGYGTSGPYAGRKAYDLLIQCETGVLAVTGSDDHPAKAGIPVADIAAGMYAFSGVLTSLYNRQRTGTGESIEISLLEALAEWMGYPALFTRYTGVAPARTGMRHATIAPYGAYRSADGDLIFLAVQHATEWQDFCSVVLERPEVATDPNFATNEARVENYDQLDKLIGSCVAELATAEMERRLQLANVAFSPFGSVSSLLEHPQLAARGRWADVDSPVGPITTLVPPINLGGHKPVMAAIPSLGEHTVPVLKELGLTGSEIDLLQRQRGI